LIAGAVLMTPFLPTVIRDIAAAPLGDIGVLLFLGICGSGLAFLSWAKAISIAKRTADVTNFMYLTPFIAALLAFVMFRETPGWGCVIGGAVILFGLWMFQKKA